ncbi:MAG: FmdB family zinc ribbon protein [Planctomycetaceae bacterium]
MPTYDYRCDACGHELALFQSITAPARRTCPKCSKRRFRRLIGSGAGIIFRGSGFYETDYKRKRGGGESGGETKPAEAPKKEGAAKESAPKGSAPAKSATKKAAE